MLRLRFGIRVDMSEGGDTAAFDALVGDVTGISAASTTRLSASTTTGASVTLLGRFDLADEDSLRGSSLTGMEVLDGAGLLVFRVTGIRGLTLDDVDQQRAASDVTDLIVRAAGTGVSITSARFDDVLVGVNGPDYLASGAGNDVLTGLAGNDTLDGGAGNDVLNGGRGADRMGGGGGDDRYIVDSAQDVVLESAHRGLDTVRASVSFTLAVNVENLSLSGRLALTAPGNEAANSLNGNSGANVLKGLGGDDKLNGGGGADRMEGGRGDDVYFVDSRKDVLIENAGAGDDSVRSSIDYSLGANLEKLTLLGNANLDGVGNRLDNELRGNRGDNFLRGGGGNDTLYAGNGHDILSGGAGTDYFVFTTRNDGSDSDRVSDFLSGTDQLWLPVSTFSSLLAGVVVSTQFRDSNSVSDGNDFLVYDLASGVLAYDAGGSGTFAETIAQLGPGTVLLASDIHII